MINSLNREFGLYQLMTEEAEPMALIAVVYPVENDIIKGSEELMDSWRDWWTLEEHDCDKEDMDEFVEWHNENYVTQIVRLHTTEITPD